MNAPKIPKPRAGHVKTAIRRRFIVTGQAALTTSDLLPYTHCARLWRGDSSPRDRHNYRRAIRHACEKLGLERAGYASTRGGPVLWALPSVTQ